MNKKHIILSPHLDDAFFSLGENIHDWINQGISIHIINIFSSYGNKSQYEKLRKSEDLEVISSYPSISHQNLDYLDAIVRLKEYKVLDVQKGIYKNKIHHSEQLTIKNLSKKLLGINIKKNDKIFTCMGVGDHLDHIIISRVATKIFNNKQLYFYLDIPYCFNIKKTFNLLLTKKNTINFRTLQIKIATENKFNSIKKYLSQYKLLFKNDLPHLEILFRLK